MRSISSSAFRTVRTNMSLEHAAPNSLHMHGMAADIYMPRVGVLDLAMEALTLSQKFGLDLEKTLDVIYGTTATNGQLKIQGDGYVPVGDLGRLAVPETLTALIASRLDALDPPERSLLHDAAVLGQSFTLAA